MVKATRLPNKSFESLSNEDDDDGGDGNENVKKRLKKQNNNFARAARFWVHFLAVRARPPREISSCDVL